MDTQTEAAVTLLPDRYRNRDFFVADLFDWTPKDDVRSMEHPLFSLSKQKDTHERHYEHNGNSIDITPSSAGMPTIWDKDILIYAISQYIAAIDRNRKDANRRRVQFIAFDYFVNTNRRAGGTEYDRLKEGLRRLRGMTIVTDLETDGERVAEGFGLIESFRIVKKKGQEKMIACEMVLSEWLHRAILAREVLSISRDYFRLGGGLERRLYELARKHCGHQAVFKIGVELLHAKSGSRSPLKWFRHELKRIAASDVLPDYRMAYVAAKDQAVFYSRDARRLVKAARTRISHEDAPALSGAASVGKL